MRKKILNVYIIQLTSNMTSSKIIIQETRKQAYLIYPHVAPNRQTRDAGYNTNTYTIIRKQKPTSIGPRPIIHILSMPDHQQTVDKRSAATLQRCDHRSAPPVPKAAICARPDDDLPLRPPRGRNLHCSCEKQGFVSARHDAKTTPIAQR